MMRALITGISGQDGSYLAELLLSRDYEVHGLIRRNSIPENQSSRIDHLLGKVQLWYGDVTDAGAVRKVICDVKPDLVFNLAGQSHVRVSFDIPHYTTEVNAVGVLNVLDAVRTARLPNTRFYQASSSEIFGNSVGPKGYQTEDTPMQPVSPYGCAKLYGYHIVKHYRRAYGMFACNGILFNHESPRRGANFVTAKVVKTAVQISLGLADQLVLGNLNSFRDWGHSRDYVDAMLRIISYEAPTDFVVATGECYSVRDLCERVFGLLGLNWQKYVRQDPSYCRPEELRMLRGDAARARELLGWEPRTSFDDLIREMVDHWKGILCRSVSTATPNPK